MKRTLMVGLCTLAACGPASSAAPPKAAGQAQRHGEVEVDPAASAAASEQLALRRAVLEAVLRKGPGWLLAQVPIEEVVEKDAFVGWRVLELPSGWAGRLESGDVVTAVNAMPIEKPDQLWTAWTSLSVASELKISYLRDGQAGELRLPIVGAPDEHLAKELRAAPGGTGEQGAAPPQPRGPGRKKTVVIKGDDRPLSDTLVDWSQ